MRFVLVDRIIELDPSKHVVAEKFIDPAEDYFADHFPGYPLVPGVLMVEMMAQAAGKCLMAGIDDSQWPVLVQVLGANFRRIVQPPCLLRIDATITRANRSTARADGFVTNNGKRVAEASLLFGYVAKRLLTKDFVDPVLHDFLREQRKRAT